MDNIKITIQGCWHEADEIAKLKRNWEKCHKDVTADFTDGGDYFSNWTFEGPVDQVEDILRHDWDLDPTLDFEEALTELSGDCDLEYKFY